MTTIKDKIKKEEYADWIKCTLGLHKTTRALYDYVKEKIWKYTHSQLQSSQNSFTQDELNHINTGGGCIRIGLLSKVKGKNDGTVNKKKWEWKHSCQKCKGAFQKILTLHTGESQLHLENSDDTSCDITLEWAIAKMFMTKRNERNKGPEDTDPAALLTLLLNCNLFTHVIQQSHKNIDNLRKARNSLYHSPDNCVKATDKIMYFRYMKRLLKDVYKDVEAEQTTIDTINEDIKVIKKLKKSEISVTLYDDALKIKRKGIHDDFEKCLSKIESEKDIEHLRKLLKLAEKAGADLQALEDDLKNTGLYKKVIEQIKEQLNDMREKTRDISEKVKRDLEIFQRVELQRVVDQVTATLVDVNENRKEIIKHFDILIVVIIVGATLLAIMFRMWTLNCYGEP